MFKKILAFVLGLVPCGVFAERLPDVNGDYPAGYLVGSGIPGVGPSAPVVGGDCYINGGILSCSDGGTNFDFVNAGNIESGKPGIYGDLSYAGFDGTPANNNKDKFDPIKSISIGGSLMNENWLVLAPGSATNISKPNGTIYIGGHVYNGTLDGATFDDAPSTGTAAVSNSRLVMEGSSVTINGKDANGVAVLNVGERAIAGNQIVTGGTPGNYTYAHSTVTAADSLSIQSNSGDISIGGSVWNNTANGTSGRVAGNNADLVRFGATSAQNLTVAGDVVNFGAYANFRAGNDLSITGDILSGHGDMRLETTNGILTVGDITLNGDATSIVLSQGGTASSHNGISMGALTIASGSGRFTSDTFITVNGDINVSGAGSSNGVSFMAKSGAFRANDINNSATLGDFSVTATNGITANAITNSAGKMTLKAGTGSDAKKLIADSITSNVGGTIILDGVSDFSLSNTTTALDVRGALYVGDTTGTNGGNGDVYFTTNSGVYNSATKLFENVITARGSVNIDGSVIINSGRGLYIVTPSTDYINVTMGNVNNTSGGLFVGTLASMADASGYGIRSFSSDAMTVSGTLTNQANTKIYVTNDGSANNDITMGVVQNGTYSNMYLRADDNIEMLSFANMEKTSGNVDIIADRGNISMTGGTNSGFLENMALGAAKMIVNAKQGDISTAKHIQNSGAFMQLLAAGDVNIGGALKNDMEGGTGKLLIGTDGVFDSEGNLSSAYKVKNLTVEGWETSAVNGANASLVNTGTFLAVVDDLTHLKYGIDLTLVPETATFYLDTGRFVMDNPNGVNGIQDLFKNRISNFTLKVRNGNLDVADLINGAKKLPTWNNGAWDYSAPGTLANVGANMYVLANNLKGTSVTNIGSNLTLIADAPVVGGNIVAPDNGAKGHLWITNNVLNGTAGDGKNPINNGVNALTKLQTNGILAVDGGVFNFATLYLSGEAKTILNNVINYGKTYITSRTDLGIIDINGAINNRGTSTTGKYSFQMTDANYDLAINAKEINLNGDFYSESGNTLIKASDGGAVNVDMKNLFVDGGQVDIDALMGVKFDGILDVNSGLVNFSQSTRSIIATGNIEIDGNMNAQTTYDYTSGSVNLESNNVVMESGGNIRIAGNLLAKETSSARNLTLKSSDIKIGTDGVGGNMTAEGTGVISIGALADGINPAYFVDTLDVVGKMWAKTGARIILNATNTTVGTLQNDGRIDANGIGLIADAAMTGNAINLTNGLYFDNLTHTTGFIIGSAGKRFDLSTTGAGADINIAANASDVDRIAISVNDGNILNITSADRLIVGGNITNTAAALNMNATGDVAIAGNINSAATGSTFKTAITGNGIRGQDIENAGNFDITSTAGAIQFENIVNKTGALMNLGNATYSTVGVTTASFTQDGGVANVYGSGWTVTNVLDLNAGNVNLYTNRLTADTIYIKDNLVQNVASGTLDGNLNVTVNSTVITANSLDIDGNLDARAQAAGYNIKNDISVGKQIIVADGASTVLLSTDGAIVVNGNGIAAGVATVDNSGDLSLFAKTVSIANGVKNNAAGTMSIFGDDINLGHVDNTGLMAIDSGNSKMLQLAGLDTHGGTVTLGGIGLRSTGAVNISGTLNQNAGFGGAGDVDINEGSYLIDLTNNGAVPNSIEIANGILQGSGDLTIKTSSLAILGGGIDAAGGDGVSIVSGNPCMGSGCTPPAGAGIGEWFPWLDANIVGSISDGVKFYGIGDMTIDGDYTFGDRSILQASVLPEQFARDNAPNHYHYGNIGIARDREFGQITMGDAAAGIVATPIIDIVNGGKFISEITASPDLANGGVTIKDGQIGISIFDSVDSGTVIWLAHADGGIEDTGSLTFFTKPDGTSGWTSSKLRDVTVGFCNANGSKCFNYIDAIRDANGLLYSKSPLAGSDDDTDLPIYILLREGENGGDNPDNIYIVFNPEFGGPINIFKIQPEVDRDPQRTDNEYGTAGAIDDLVEGALINDGFFFTAPIETIPFVFNGTNMETIGNELYKRMEQYKLDYDPTGLARFSRLFVPREQELIAGDINLIEHSASRSFANRMTDEFLWNRNRNLKKIWADFEVGFFNQNLTDDLETKDGNKFTLNLGVDWRAGDATVVGFAGRVNHLSSSVTDTIDLSYKGGANRTPIPGKVDIDVTTTNVGLGAYLLTTFSREVRLYGNAFVDMYMIDVTRDQNFISTIDGSGNAYSITTEWGLLHDLSNQYFVGNLYLRAGYNTGFDITEKAGGADYMKLQSDGYFSLTPGYSLTVNKAFYLSPWFKMRPYLTVGVEYDVMGMDDVTQYKFALAQRYTDYDIKIDPLWTSGAVGVEFLAVSGWQFGVNYEYKFNPEITLHNIRLSGSYRF